MTANEIKCHAVRSLINETGILLSMSQIKDIFHVATKRWVGKSTIGYRDNLSNFVNLVIKRELNLDYCLIGGSETQHLEPSTRFPHVKVTVDRITFQKSRKKEENCDISFWHMSKGSKIKIDYNTDNVGVKEMTFLSANKYIKSSINQRSYKDIEYFEMIVSKKDISKLAYAKNVIQKGKIKTDLRLGTLEISLGHAFKYDSLKQPLPILLDGKEIGNVDVTFNFVNQTHLHEVEELSRKILKIAASDLECLLTCQNGNQKEKRRQDLKQSSFETLASQQIQTSSLSPSPNVTAELDNSKSIALPKKTSELLKYYVMLTALPFARSDAPTKENTKNEVSIQDDIVGQAYLGEDVVDSTDSTHWVMSFPNKDVVFVPIEVGSEGWIPFDSFMNDQLSLSLSSNSVTTASISVWSIPWINGMELSIGAFSCRLEIVSNYRSVCEKEADFVQLLKYLVFMIYHNHLYHCRLTEVQISSWNGNMAMERWKTIVGMVAFFISKKEWEEVESWAILKLFSSIKHF